MSNTYTSLSLSLHKKKQVRCHSDVGMVLSMIKFGAEHIREHISRDIAINFVHHADRSLPSCGIKSGYTHFLNRLQLIKSQKSQHTDLRLSQFFPREYTE